MQTLSIPLLLQAFYTNLAHLLSFVIFRLLVPFVCATVAEPGCHAELSAQKAKHANVPLDGAARKPRSTEKRNLVFQLRRLGTV